jgi:hypothetical protein
MQIHSSAFLVVMALAASASAEPTRDYVVRDRETCLEIAVRELGSTKDLVTLHRLNPQLGALPHTLKAGQVVRLPLGQTVVPDAHLSQQRGPVEVRRAGDESWQSQATGTALFRAWRVGAREKATARVTFHDTSTIAMRENTVVVIFGPSEESAKTGTFHTSLETGALRTRLAELDGKTLRVTTPSGELGLGGGTAVVAVDPRQTTRVSNHAGAPAKLRGAGRKKTVAIAAGFGAKVSPSQDPSPPRPLPQAPTWPDASPILATGWIGQGGQLRATWTAGPDARRFLVELSRDPELGSIELSLDVAATVTSIDAQRVPPGDYFLAVSAVDADGFESVPSQVRAVRVVELTPPASSTPNAGGLIVPIGGVFEAPTGVQCSIDKDPPASRVVFTVPGPAELRCNGSGIGLPLRVANVVVLELGAPTRIAFGGTADIRLSVQSELLPTVPLVATTDGDLEATFTPGTPPLIRVRARTPGTHVVRLVAGATELGRVTVVVAPATDAAPPASTSPPPRPRFEIGMFAGSARIQADTYLDLGISVARRLHPMIAIEAGVSHQRGALNDALLQAGAAFSPHPARVELRFRAGVMMRVGGITDAGGYVGIDAVGHLSSRISVIVGVDAPVLDQELAIFTTGGVRFAL